MEFKLNKIDTDVRHRIEEQTQEGKVHSKHGINIQKHQEKKHSKNNDFYEKMNRRRKKK